MNKKLIAVGIAAALAVPFVAQAGTEVYGQARMSVDFTNNNDPGATQSDSAISVSSNNSRLGFRGDEDLNNGMTLTWQVEQGLKMDKGEAFSENRNTYLGLGGNYGTVLAGRHDTPNKIISAPLDIFADTLADFNTIVFGDRRDDNIILYFTPDMGGFKFMAAYIPSYTNDTLAQTQAENDQNGFSAAGLYNDGVVYVALSYESLAEIGGGKDLTTGKLVGTYDFGQGTKIGALYEAVDPGIASDYNNWYLNLSHTMGDTTFKLAYGNHDETADNLNDAATQFTLGVAQNLSQNTEVYALYTAVNNDPKSARTLKGLSGQTAGEDASGISFGFNHKFSSR